MNDSKKAESTGIEIDPNLVDKLAKVDERRASSMVAAMIATQVSEFTKKD